VPVTASFTNVTTVRRPGFGRITTSPCERSWLTCRFGGLTLILVTPTPAGTVSVMVVRRSALNQPVHVPVGTSIVRVPLASTTVNVNVPVSPLPAFAFLQICTVPCVAQADDGTATTPSAARDTTHNSFNDGSRRRTAHLQPKDGEKAPSGA